LIPTRGSLIVVVFATSLPSFASAGVVTAVPSVAADAENFLQWTNDMKNELDADGEKPAEDVPSVHATQRRLAEEAARRWASEQGTWTETGWFRPSYDLELLQADTEAWDRIVKQFLPGGSHYPNRRFRNY